MFIAPAVSERTPLQFPRWKEALAHAPIPPVTRERWRRALLSFLRHCKQTRSPATVALIRGYLATSRDAGAREALRWFYRHAEKGGRADGAGRRSGDGAGATPERGSTATLVRPKVGTRPGGRSEPPPVAAQDLGGADWERDLIRAARAKGFLWRTEETYRQWGARFAAFLRPRSPDAATAEEVAEFLTALAVQQRASPATQRQALNALVFLLQEALHRELGEIRFRRAAPRERMPTVLSPEECERLFGQLEGTTRLMAELMYGSGLRLMELLRLRVHHVDFERRQLRVAGGKGDRVNGFANAAPSQHSGSRALHLCFAVRFGHRALYWV